MRKIYFIQLLVLFTLCFAQNKLNAVELAIAAKQAIAIEYSTGETLFTHNAEEKMSPSSMSKLMTLYVIFSKLHSGILKETDLYTVSNKAFTIGGSTMFLKEGQKVTVKDLINGVIVVSGNDACITLAEGSSGNEAVFVSEMNKVAMKLGLKSSNFMNSSGWPNENHYMTAKDLATLAMQLYTDFPQYYKLFKQEEFSFNGVTQKNTNTLLWKEEDVDGLKTGHTSSGGYGVVVSAVNDGDRRIFVVVNGLESGKQREEDARKLLRFGFANFETSVIFRKHQEIARAKVIFGQKKYIPLMLEKDLIITYPRLQKEEMIIVLRYYNNLVAPIFKNQEIGRISLYLQDGKKEEIVIRANENVKRLSIFYAALQLLRL